MLKETLADSCPLVLCFHIRKHRTDKPIIDTFGDQRFHHHDNQWYFYGSLYDFMPISVRCAEKLLMSYLSFTWCVGTSSLCVLWESPWQPAAVDHRSPETDDKTAFISIADNMWDFITYTCIFPLPSPSNQMLFLLLLSYLPLYLIQSLLCVPGLQLCLFPFISLLFFSLTTLLMPQAPTTITGPTFHQMNQNYPHAQTPCCRALSQDVLQHLSTLWHLNRKKNQKF